MAVVTTNPRVTAADPGAWLDGEPWTFTLNFTNPGSTTPTDLTGSRLFVKLQAQGPAGLVPIQICDSAAGDGSLTIAPGTGGQITINAVPEARTWTAPRFGPGLLLLPAVVIGDVYRQVGTGEPVGLTRLTLRVLPTTGAPVGSAGPLPVALIGQVPASASLSGAVTITPIISLAGTIAASAGLIGAATVSVPSARALAGTVQGSGALAGSLAVVPAVALVGAISASATLRGSLLISVALVGNVAGNGVLGGSVGSVAAQPLTGSVPAPNGPAGSLSVAGTYAGAINGSGMLTGTMSTAVALSGSVAPSPTLSGNLTAIAPANLTGAVPAPVGPRGSTTITPGLVNARKGRLMAAAAA